MKPTILLTIVFVMSLLTAYSQDTSKLNLKEITTYLIEGLECKEILIERNKQIRNRDTIITIQKVQLDTAYKINTFLINKNTQLESKINTSKKRNMFFKGTTSILLLLIFLI